MTNLANLYRNVLFVLQVQRFIDQVHNDKVALSGLQFFYVTKGLILSVSFSKKTQEQEEETNENK